VTDAEIIQAAVRDPVVISARSMTKADGTVVGPAAADLLAAAQTELTCEIQSLLADEAISRALLEREHALGLTTGGTNVQQGTWWEVPGSVGMIIGATIGDTRQPLDVMTSREEFNRWWYFKHGEQSLSDTAEVIIQWDPPASDKRAILISPGRGSDSTLYLLHRQRVVLFSVTAFDTEDHHLVLLGLKNRMSGGRFQAGYDQTLAAIKGRIHPILHRPTPMRRDPRVERLAWRLRDVYGGGTPDTRHYYRSSS